MPDADPHWLTRSLWWCSGSVPELVRQSRTEWARHAGIGGAVLSTWCLASFAGGYALYTVAAGSAMQIPIALVGGAIWGLIIFNIDRFLVSSLRKSGQRSLREVVRSELLPATPRLLFAVVIALTIAEPLELRLFSSEIEARVEANRDQLVAEREASLTRLGERDAAAWREEMTRIDARVTASRDRVERLQREYIEESDGRGGSGRVGDGPLTGLKREEMERAAAEHRELLASTGPRRADLIVRLDSSAQQLRDQLAAYRASLGTGYLARREALANLYDERPGVWGAVWGIFLLMVMVEITPLLLKIFGPFGAYDAKLAMSEESAIHEARMEQDYRVAMATYHFQLAQQAERAVEDASHEAGVQVRTSKVREAWAGFGATFPQRSYASVDELVRHFRNALFSHRQ